MFVLIHILPEVEFPEVADQVQIFIDTALKLAKMNFSQKNKAISLSWWLF